MHLTETIIRGGGRVREDSSPGRIQPAPLLQTLNFRRKSFTEFLVMSDRVFYYFHFIQ